MSPSTAGDVACLLLLHFEPQHVVLQLPPSPFSCWDYKFIVLSFLDRLEYTCLPIFNIAASPLMHCVTFLSQVKCSWFHLEYSCCFVPSLQAG